MNDFKYTLIISQYYHSRHMYIVKHDKETFLNKAKALVAELEQHKRSNLEKAIKYGDLEYHLEDKIYPRYNVNDEGDIYFINSHYVNYLKDEAIEYSNISRREAVGFKKKEVLSAIGKHHYREDIKRIVEKYFEII